MDLNWNQDEENLIAKAMADLAYARPAAIRHLRNQWVIGETRPVGWGLGRPMPEANPRFGTVPDPDPDGLNPVKTPASGQFEASTQVLTSSETTPGLERRQRASARQARWREKRALKAELNAIAPPLPDLDIAA